MTESEKNYYQNCKRIGFGADGKVSDVQNLNPQQLLKTGPTDDLLAWLASNVPEGNTWTRVDEHEQMTNNNTQFAFLGTGSSNRYTCPCWKAVAANGASFNAGELWYNLFERVPPTQAVLDELHSLAGPAAA
jgi:hypothetical protein